MRSKPWLLWAAAAALCGCGRNAETSDTDESIQSQLTALRNEVSSLALMVADGRSLHGDVGEIRDAVRRLEYQAMNERMVTLRPNSEGYSVIRTTLGQITVDIASISANANGASVALTFGNPLACDLRDVEMWIRYGETDNVGNPVEGGGKSKQVKLGKTLRGGRFTTVRVGLDDIKPDKLGYISIGNMNHGGVALTQ
jgi:hypothetical protein